MSRQQSTFALGLLLLTCFSLSFLLLIQLQVRLSAAQGGAAAEDKQGPFALIKTIIATGSDRTRRPDVTVVHAGTTVGASLGMILYAGDEVTTGADVKVIILFLDKQAENHNEVVLDAKTHVQLGSLFTWGGRVLASVKGYFETKTNRARWSVQGTEYELVVADDGTNQLRVLKGSVSAETGDFGPTVAADGETDRLPQGPMFLPAAFREPEALPQQRRMEFVAFSGRVTRIEREFVLTNTCDHRHLYQVSRPVNLDWFQFLGADQFSLEGHETRTIRFSIKLDGTNVPVGIKESVIAFPCQDCSTEPRCESGGLFLSIIVNVRGNSPTPTPTATAQPTSSIGESAEASIAARMQEITLPPAGPLQRSQASLPEIDETLNWSNEVIVRGEPTYSAQSVVPRFAGAEERNQVFREARRSSIVNDDQQSKETLAAVYLDWGNGAKAEGELKRLRSSSPETPERLTALGEAYRLMGDLKMAERLLMRATLLAPSSAPAFNALGNVYLDQAKVAQDRNNPRTASDFLERAKAEYAKALKVPPLVAPDRLNHTQSRPTVDASKTVAQSNLGEVHLRLGQLARAQGKGDEALREYQAAEQAFGNAAKIDSSYQFAYTGLGDVYRENGETLADSGDEAGAAQYFAKSQTHYDQALKRHSDMAEAWVGLGRVLDDTGQHREALNRYLRATQVRPELPEPHYYLAVALVPYDPRRAAEQASAYFRVERDQFRYGQKGNEAKLAMAGRYATSPSPGPVMALNTVPNFIGLSRNEALQRLRESGELPGNVVEVDSDMPPGSVIEQNPKPGQTVPPGTRVDLVIARSASPLVPVPHVNGDTPEKALRKLRDKGLEGEIQEQADCKANGKVTSTKPGRDQSAPKGSTVIVYISGPGAITVPPVVKLQLSEAEQELRNAGLKSKLGRKVEDNSVAENTVLEQRPRAGSKLAPNCEVELSLAIKVRLIPVPTYVGLSKAEALQRLPKVFGDFTRGSVTEALSNQPPGTVIEQFPKAGKMERPGTSVSLVVAKGISVPNVVGMSYKDAKNALEAKGLVLEVLEGDTDKPVSAQDPPPESQVPPGKHVKLKFPIKIIL